MSARGTESKFSREGEMRDKFNQKLVALLLLYAAKIAWFCPCRKTISCHLPHFFSSVGAATAITAYDNWGK